MNSFTKLNWKNIKHGVAYYDSFEKTYNIVIDTKVVENPESKQLTQIGEQFRGQASQLLLDYYSVNSEDGIDSSLFLAESYFFNRPGGFLKLKYSILKEDWLSLTSQNTEEVEFNSLVEFDSESIYTKFNKLEKKLKSIEEKISQSGQTLKGFSLQNEIKKIKEWIKSLSSLALLNKKNIRKDENDSITIYFADNEIVQIELEQGFDKTLLTTGLSRLKSRSPFNSKRTNNYILNLHDMITDNSSSWYSYLDKYTIDLPDLTPSEQSSGNSENKKREKEYEELKNSFDSHYKTAREKIEEIALISKEFKNKLSESIRRQYEESSTRIQSDSINTVEDAYNLILNKISLENLIGTAVSNAASCLPIEDAVESWQRGAFIGLELSSIEAVFQNSLSSEEFGELQKEVRVVGPCGEKLNIAKTKENYLNKFYDSMDNERLIFALENLIPSLSSLSQTGLEGIQDYVYEIDELIEEEVDSIVSLAPEPPTLEFPENLPILDLIESVPKAIEEAINSTVESIALGVAKGLAEQAQEVLESGTCNEQSDPNNFGTIAPSEIFGEPQKLIDIFKEYDLPPDLFSNSLSEDGAIVNNFEIAEIQNFLQTVFESLTRTEICQLLSGVASERVVNFVYTTLSNKFPNFEENVEISELNTIFSGMSELGDMSVCAFEELPETTTTYPCEPVSDDDSEQRKREIESSKRILEELGKLSGDEPFQSMMPPLNCTPETGRSLFTPKDPTVDFLSDITLDTFISTFIVSFNAEISGFTSNLLESVPVDEFGRTIGASTQVSASTTEVKVLPELQERLRDPESFKWNQESGRSKFAGFNLSNPNYDLNINYNFVGIPNFQEDGNEENEDGINIESGKQNDNTLINSNFLSEEFVFQRDLSEESFYQDYINKISGLAYNNVPQKALAFTNLIKEKLEEKFIEFNEFEFNEFLKDLLEKQFYKFYVETLLTFGDRISKSTLFEKRNLLNLNFVPLSSNSKKGKKIDCSGDSDLISPIPLIDIQELKEEALKRNEELLCASCPELMNNSFQQTLLESIIETTCRLFVVEDALSDIYTYGEYSLNKDGDVSFIYENLRKSLSSRNFFEDFSKQVLKYVQQRIDAQVLEESEAIKIVILKHVEGVANAMSSILTGRIAVTPPNILDILPQIDAPNSLNDVRFTGNTIPTFVDGDEEALNKISLEGGFYLERFVYVESEEYRDGVWSFREFDKLIQQFSSEKLSNSFTKLKYGLRFMTAVPYELEKIRAQNILGSPNKGSKQSFNRISKENFFLLKENSFVNQPENWSDHLESSSELTLRTFPLFEAMTDIEAETFYDLRFGNLISQFPFDELMSIITNSNGFEAFNYAYSSSDLLNIIGLFNKLSLSKILNFEVIFNDSKKTLKSLFYTALEGNNYQHQSNPDSLNTVDDFQLNFNTNFEISKGVDPCKTGTPTSGIGLSMALKTPIWIFKGIAENLDPAIMISEKIRKGSDLPEIALPGIAIPLGLNPFTPLTPIGAAYLGLAFSELSDKFSDIDCQAIKEEKEKKEQDCDNN